MSKNDIIEIAKTLNDHGAPELRQYVYATWIASLFTVVAFYVGVFLIWKFRKEIRERLHDFPIEIALVILSPVCVMTLCWFIEHTLHVWMTPEIEAIKLIIK